MALFAPTFAKKTFKIALGYSPSVDSLLADVRGEIALEIAGTNLIYENSQIDAEMRLAKLFRCDIPPPTSEDYLQHDLVCLFSYYFERDTVNYLPLDNPYFGRHYREKYSADEMAFFVYAHSNTLCGGSPGRGGGFWLEAQCAHDQEYAPGILMAHEMGHAFGVDHDRFYGHGKSKDSAGLAYYPFAYGYYNKPGTDTVLKRWMDVMSYNCGDYGSTAADSALGPPWWPCSAYHTVVPYLSNPDISYPPTGEPMGTYAHENAALAHNLYIDTLASNQVEPGYLFLQDTLFSKEIGNPAAVDSMTVANFLVKDAGQLNITAGKSVRFQNFKLQDYGRLSVVVGTPAPLSKTSARHSDRETPKNNLPAFAGEPPQIVRVGDSFYLLNAGGSESLRLAAFDIYGRRLFSQTLSTLSGNGRYWIPFSKKSAGGFLMFRIENERGVFWSKAGPR